MTRLLALFLAALVLLQTLGQEVLVVSYELNKARIAARYCVNKARPQLRCHGKCHLARQLRQAEGGDRKTPAPVLAKAKHEVLPPAALVLRAPRRWRLPVRRYPAPPPAHCAPVPTAGVFRPPLRLA